MMGEMERVDRLARGPIDLLRQAAGSPREIAAKIARLAIALRGYASRAVIDDRLQRLRDLGYIETVPNRVQLVVGAADMLRFFISPAAADYYEQKGINFTFHQVLRILDEPASMVDPTGFFSSRDNIIGHVMQVVHANPVYDLQLLEAHASGLDELERQVEEMIAGTHPRARSIRAIVEDPDYHARLLRFVREYRADRASAPPIRDNVASDRFRDMERTFGTLPAAMRYFAKLPRTPIAAARHLVRVREFPRELAEP
jgi:hypothetical protein